MQLATLSKKLADGTKNSVPVTALLKSSRKAPHELKRQRTQTRWPRFYLTAASTIAMSCSFVPPLTPMPAYNWPSCKSGTPPPMAV